MFGSNLRKLRRKKGLSQADISKELYVVRQTVSIKFGERCKEMG